MALNFLSRLTPWQKPDAPAPIRDRLRLSRALRLGVIACVAFIGILLFVPQSSEVLIVELAEGDKQKILRGYLAVLLLSAAILVYTFETLIASFSDEPRLEERRQLRAYELHRREGRQLRAYELLRGWTGSTAAIQPDLRARASFSFSLKWAPLALSLVPVISYALKALLVAAPSPPEGQCAIPYEIRGSTRIFVGVLLIAFILGLYTISYFQYVTAKAIIGGAVEIKRFRDRSTDFLMPVVLGTAAACIILATYQRPAYLGVRLGPITVFSYALLTYFVAFSLVQKWSYRSNRPWFAYLISVLAAVHVAAWFFGWARDSYFLNHRPPNSALSIQMPQDKNAVADALGFSWPAKSLADWRARTKSQRPILVAAQGGGIYAAYHSALTLARLQDRCSDFADRVFALSGVSGGALGLSVFLAAVDAERWLASNPQSRQRDWPRALACSEDAQPNWQGPHELLVRKFFTSDLLTPVVAAGFFLDFSDYIVPRRLYQPEGSAPWADRARALEWAIAANWERVLRHHYGADAAECCGNFFNQPLRYISKARSGPLPNFITLGTLVETGEPIFASNLVIARSGAPGDRLHFLPFVDPGADISIAAAVVMSSRFPIASPEGAIENVAAPFDHPKKLARVRVVDGGYFENSGALGLMEVIPTLEKGELAPTIITFQHEQLLPYDGQTFRELLSPFRAALNAGTVSGLDYVRRLKAYCHPGTLCADYLLIDRCFAPPLGWLLSQPTRQEIEARSGFSGAQLRPETTMGANNEHSRRLLQSLKQR